MAKPNINKITPFDANMDKVISMSWSGNQAYGNRVVLYDKDDLTVVFDDTVDSFSLTHRIPAKTLINGKCYIIQTQVIDYEGTVSSLSDKYYFYVFETPVFVFEGITDGDTIHTSSLGVNMIYKQVNFESIFSYKFSIYDVSRALLMESNLMYDTDSLCYIFKGLSHNTTYYIRCHGNTQNGMELDTGYVKLLIYYEYPGAYSRLFVENDTHNGCISYRTNINLISPSGGDHYTYVDGKINLLGDTLVYDSGFKIEKDFTLKISGTHLYRSGDIIIPSNDVGSFKITAFIYDDESIRYKFIAPNAITSYLLYTKPLYCTKEDLITIVLRRRNNLYEITAYQNGGD